MNRTWHYFSPFGTHTAWLLSMLAGGIDGSLPPTTFHASKGRLAFKIKGVVVAEGRDCEELMTNWEAEVAKAKAAKRADSTSHATSRPASQPAS